INKDRLGSLRTPCDIYTWLLAIILPLSNCARVCLWLIRSPNIKPLEERHKLVVANEIFVIVPNPLTKNFGCLCLEFSVVQVVSGDAQYGWPKIDAPYVAITVACYFFFGY